MKFLWLMFVIVSLFVFNAARGGQESHGGDVFDIGGALKLFDVLEHSQEFMPTDIKEYQDIVKPQLEILKEKLPRTGKYLEGMFTRGIRPRWYFVDYKLKDIKDEGSTSLALTFKKMQIARNTGTVVQIQKDLWDKLEPKNRAWLLMHEALWSAVGVDFVKTGAPIRRLTSLPFHKNLKLFSKNELEREISDSVESETSPLRRVLSIDGEHVRAAVGEWEDISTLDDGISPSGCFDETDQCVFKDKKTGLWWTERSPGMPDDKKKGDDIRTWESAKQFCTSLKNWGGVADGWRLPSKTELLEVQGNKLREVALHSHPFGSTNAFYWSNSTTEEGPITAVNLSNAQVRTIDPKALTTWRCVKHPSDSLWMDKSTDTTGKNSVACSPNSQCVLQNKKTKLLWTAEAPGYKKQGAYYDSAALACAQLNWGGYNSDWRLPKFKEAEQAVKSDFARILYQFDEVIESWSFWTSSLFSTYSAFGASINFWVGIEEQAHRHFRNTHPRWNCVREIK